jgi:predicted nucleotidyltransferase component of viral defense system
MKFDPSSFPAAAKATGFQSNNLEKVLRLRELLTEFQKHSFLGGRLVLKGGTALNLFYLGLTRLSVDIDLNYIAHLEREAMLAERSEIVKAVEQVSAGLGYKVQNGIDDHALREWHLGYVNHAGAQERIQVEASETWLSSSAQILKSYSILLDTPPEMEQFALYRTRGICARPRLCQSCANAGLRVRQTWFETKDVAVLGRVGLNTIIGSKTT